MSIGVTVAPDSEECVNLPVAPDIIATNRPRVIDSSALSKVRCVVRLGDQRTEGAVGKANEPERCGVCVGEDSYDISMIVYLLRRRRSRRSSTRVIEGFQYRDVDLSVTKRSQKAERE